MQREIDWFEVAKQILGPQANTKLVSRHRTRFGAFRAADQHQFELFATGVTHKRFPTHVQVVPSPWWCVRRKFSVVER